MLGGHEGDRGRLWARAVCPGLPACVAARSHTSFRTVVAVRLSQPEQPHHCHGGARWTRAAAITEWLSGPGAIRCWAVALMIVAPDQTVMLTSWRPLRRWFRRRTISRARRGNGDAACCQPAQSQGAAGAIRPPQRMGEGIAVVKITHHRHRPCGSSAGRAKVTRMAPSRRGLAFLINCSRALALSHPDRADSPPRGQAHPDCLGTGRRAGAGGDVVSVGNLVPAKEPSRWRSPAGPRAGAPARGHPSRPAGQRVAWGTEKYDGRTA
jgi:hypothetical protein